MKHNLSITGINALLFLYLIADDAASLLFDPSNNQDVPWDVVYNWSPVLAIFGAIIIMSLLIFGGAGLIKGYWNSFVVDVFKLRDISYGEALSIILLLAIIS